MCVVCSYCRNHSFTASDISLQESEHRFWVVEVLDDGFGYFFLCVGECEGECPDDFFDDISVGTVLCGFGTGLVCLFLEL